jgi:hypothetical protein
LRGSEKKRLLGKKINNFLEDLLLVAGEQKLTKAMATTLIALYTLSKGKTRFSATYLELYPLLPVTGREKDENKLPTKETRRKHVYRNLKKVEEHQERMGIIYYMKSRPDTNKASCFDITNLKEMIERNFLIKKSI